MNMFKFCLVLTAFALLCFSCKKDSDDPLLTVFNVKMEFDDLANYNSGYLLDLDKDGVIDAKIDYSSLLETVFSSKWKYHEITPYNGYEISFEEIAIDCWHHTPVDPETTYYTQIFKTPTIYYKGGVIPFEGSWTSQTIRIYSYSHAGGPDAGTSNDIEYGTWQDEDYYIAFRQKSTNRLAWLKLNNYRGINYIACKFQDKGTSMVIK
jgi:hypothetical protein